MESSELLNTLREIPAESPNAKKLKNYLVKLIEANIGLPTAPGKSTVNKTAICEAAGINRQAIYPGRAAKDTLDLLQWALTNIDTDTEKAPDNNHEISQEYAYLHRELKKQSAELKRYQTLLKNTNAALDTYKTRITQLEQLLSQFQEAEKYLEHGYKVIPW